MDMILAVNFLAIIALVIAGAFFAGSETALTAVSRGKMHQLEKDGVPAAAAVNVLVGNRERLIGALLLGNTFVNILASSLATSVLEDRLGHRVVPVVTLLMTLLVLVFAEVLPKTLAIVRTDRFALAVAGPLKYVVGVLAPVVASVQGVVWRLLRLFGVKKEDVETAALAHDEIRGTVFLRHQEGSVERESRDMISGVLDLRELSVGDVMIHRKNMMTVSADQSAEQVVRALMATHHARVPVWRDQPENIVGVLFTKDVVRAVLANQGALRGLDIDALITPPWFVPETMALEELLDAFRERRSHFALVVDEYGVILGLVTREDILDEVFGRIPDEHGAMAQPGIRPQPDGSFYIDGVTTIRDANRALDWSLPDDEATTLAGLVIHEARTIPDVGQRFAFYGYKFEILRRQRNQITALRITPPEKAHNGSGEKAAAG
ncbi:MAG: HlyC/CorC family transporter [Alphaproteobacteria bacterium]|nr:HlyC/CorC family transporter [Alphaproteobacteria bacterium]MDE2111905.1 HlyC/CorC family transporter [Alphaproteobacteria bacterium]MDE2493152.1 HlyC/CorC family transporter [Alphaproteobacteria bacterium]